MTEPGRARVKRYACALLPVLVLMGLIGAVDVACSSTPAAAASCAADPLQCGVGETCWVKDCTCPANVSPCTPSACTEFNLACMASKATAMVGQNCSDSVGTPTCGDGQWCVQEMNVDFGDGICSSFCDPKVAGSCATGYSCVAVGVAVVASAPVIHVCQITATDSGIPTVGDDGGEPSQTDGGRMDAAVTDGSGIVPFAGK